MNEKINITPDLKVFVGLHPVKCHWSLLQPIRQLRRSPVRTDGRVQTCKA